MASLSLNELKESLNAVETEIYQKTEKFNKGINKLKDKKISLTTQIERLELEKKANSFDDLFVSCAKVGLTMDELKQYILQQNKNETPS